MNDFSLDYLHKAFEFAKRPKQEIKVQVRDLIIAVAAKVQMPIPDVAKIIYTMQEISINLAKLYDRNILIVEDIKEKT